MYIEHCIEERADINCNNGDKMCIAWKEIYQVIHNNNPNKRCIRDALTNDLFSISSNKTATKMIH